MDYYNYMGKKEEEHEALCRRCGACCGAYDDPCSHLKKDNNGKYYCDIYSNRFGPRVTVEGDKFDCVPIREIIHQHWPKDYLCAYKRIYRNGSWITQQPNVCSERMVSDYQD